jgi:hypothetical protein
MAIFLKRWRKLILSLSITITLQVHLKKKIQIFLQNLLSHLNFYQFRKTAHQYLDHFKFNEIIHDFKFIL